jgi:uncharacterized membrane protein
VLEFSAGAVLLALVITVTEMTEVVALVFALHGETGSIRHGALGAVAGTALVGGIAFVGGAYLAEVPSVWLLTGSAVTLYAFGAFLFRSTRRSYRRFWRPDASAVPRTSASQARAVQFGGGFTVGAVETVEAVIVLLSIAAAGEGPSALLGALLGGAGLVGAAALLHERIRRIKVPLLKLGATSMLFAFAVFWTGEALGARWPYADLSLLPLFLLALLLVRGAVGYLEGGRAVPVETKG